MVHQALSTGCSHSAPGEEQDAREEQRQVVGNGFVANARVLQRNKPQKSLIRDKGSSWTEKETKREEKDLNYVQAVS